MGKPERRISGVAGESGEELAGTARQLPPPALRHSHEAVRTVPDIGILGSQLRCRIHVADQMSEAYKGRTCYGGWDLGAVSDLTAWALLFPDDSDGYDVLMRFWAPESDLPALG